MQQLSLLRLFALLAVSSFAFMGNECQGGAASDTGKCGAKEVWEREYPAEQYTFGSMYAGRRYYQWEDLSGLGNICSHEHITVHYYLETEHNTPLDSFQVLGKAYWSVFEREARMEWNSALSSYEGTSNIGFAQAFPGGAAKCDFQIFVNFPSRGGESADHRYMDSLVSKAHFMVYYNKIKE